MAKEEPKAASVLRRAGIVKKTRRDCKTQETRRDGDGQVQQNVPQSPPRQLNLKEPSDESEEEVITLQAVGRVRQIKADSDEVCAAEKEEKTITVLVGDKHTDCSTSNDNLTLFHGFVSAGGGNSQHAGNLKDALVSKVYSRSMLLQGRRHMLDRKRRHRAAMGRSRLLVVPYGHSACHTTSENLSTPSIAGKNHEQTNDVEVHSSCSYSRHELLSVFTAVARATCKGPTSSEIGFGSIQKPMFHSFHSRKGRGRGKGKYLGDHFEATDVPKCRHYFDSNQKSSGATNRSMSEGPVKPIARGRGRGKGKYNSFETAHESCGAQRIRRFQDASDKASSSASVRASSEGRIPKLEKTQIGKGAREISLASGSTKVERTRHYFDTKNSSDSDDALENVDRFEIGCESKGTSARSRSRCFASMLRGNSSVCEGEPKELFDSLKTSSATVPLYIGLNLQPFVSFFWEAACELATRLSHDYHVKLQVPTFSGTTAVQGDCEAQPLDLIEFTSVKTPAPASASGGELTYWKQQFRWSRPLHMTAFYLGGDPTALLNAGVRNALELEGSAWHVRPTHLLYADGALLIVALQVLEPGLPVETDIIPHTTLLSRLPFTPGDAQQVLKQAAAAGLIGDAPHGYTASLASDSDGDPGILVLPNIPVAGVYVDLYVQSVSPERPKGSSATEATKMEAYLQCF